MTLYISINLATHNRASYLDSCLASLCTQTLDPACYEICVVNNVCTDDTAGVVAQTQARYPKHNLFMVEEKVAGLSRARNRGIAATTAPLIANIDDDATACPDWLEVFIGRFASLPQEVAAIGGEINPVWQKDPPAWLDAKMKGTLSAASGMGDEARYVRPQEGLFEGNCCYRRAALTQVGCYPIELGRVGDLLLSGEGAVNALLQAQGWRLFFEPKALINHTIHADRLNPMWMRKRAFWQGISDYAMHCYYTQRGLKTVPAISLDLPLSLADWKFLDDKDTIENLSGNTTKLEHLGFILALSGIISFDR